ncbi:MAG: endolytic transglycosylase MltG [Chloroflexi bacterium]|nr:endolytic transglycosylase MltG [Chloroflexota bacterium]MCL5273685.1 endolytic transglycosylase MltG [Chloroflexota bacterium]
MRKQQKLSPVKLVIFLAAIAALVYAASILSQQVKGINASSSRMTSLDKTVIGVYLDLLRSNDISRPLSNDPTPQTFVVSPGESVSDIGRQLQQEGLVKDGDLFRMYVRVNGLDSSINAGQFTLRPNMNIPEIAQTLQRALALETQVTIPEGKRLEEVAELLQEKVNINSDDFIRLARRADYSYPFLKDLPDGASLEGYLFPDTYRLPQNPTAQDVLLKMLDDYGAKVAPLMESAKGATNLTPRQILTLASIVEREAVVPSERPMIASVYLNRMKIGMALQADPTTQYALGYQPDQKSWWKKGLTLDDLKYADPGGYNTYVNPELPPGPIASPGLSSIEAVITPAQTDYLYFVASCNGDGTHQFSKTFEEHQTKLCQ